MKLLGLILMTLSIGLLLGHSLQSQSAQYEAGFQACQEQF